MCAAVNSDSKKKRVKTKSVLGFCNNWLTKMVPTNSKSNLKTDAVPLDNNDLQLNRNTSNQIAHQSNGTLENVDNQQQNIQLIPNSSQLAPLNNTNSEGIAWPPMQLIQNNLRPTNQNMTVIENQQNLHFNNIHGLQIGNTYHVPANTSSRKNSCNGNQKSNRRITKSIEELMSNMDEIEPQVMRIAAKFIGENWRMVFRDLDIPDAEISQIKEQYFHINVEEVIYQLLLRWKRNSDDCSIGKLSTVLWNTNNDECIKALKKYYKNLKRSQVSGGIDSSES
ncbi:protein immune deficiency [Contarinia nasturtii]|uniref:protein immune deficiency n=1 Tax=Contarinia nasturtii TaxID=265458 RepID=UPI0012D461F2|nr:protein immune deficiency [Contarinia nasturtii]